MTRVSKSQTAREAGVFSARLFIFSALLFLSISLSLPQISLGRPHHGYQLPIQQEEGPIQEWIAVLDPRWDEAEEWSAGVISLEPEAEMIQSFEIPASDDNEAGFKAIHFRDSAISVLSRHPAVVSIEPNRAIRVDSMDLGPAAVDFALTASAPQPEFYKQLGAPWNLVRVSERKYGERDWYSYGSRAGTAVNVYVIDTGIFAGHEEFGGRAIWGKSFVDSEPQDDLNGHGSHVAGTVAGLTFGAAKNATVVAVKVLDANGGGSWSNVLAAIEWVVGDVQRTQDPSILHMSITGVKSDAVDAALVAALKLPNLHVVAAAGNSGADACGSSPASAGPLGAIVVGASSQDDTVPGFSNFGKCVTLWAPGTGIDSAGIGEPRGKAGKRMSGTSMAAPVVTGIVALILSYQRTLSNVALKALLTSVATTGALQGMPGESINLLAYAYYTESSNGALETQL